MFSVKLYWYHRESEVVESPRHKLQHEGNFFCLDVNPLTPADEGTWRCVAESAHGQSSCSAALRVVSKYHLRIIYVLIRVY